MPLQNQSDKAKAFCLESLFGGKLTSLLQVQKLSVAYVSRVAVPTWALVDLSFDVGVAEILGVLGESGCEVRSRDDTLFSRLSAGGEPLAGRRANILEPNSSRKS